MTDPTLGRARKYAANHGCVVIREDRYRNMVHAKAAADAMIVILADPDLDGDTKREIFALIAEFGERLADLIKS